MDMALLAAKSIAFILPSYFANATPVVLGGGAPIDFGRKMGDGNRLFGEGKTIRGFLSGVLAAVLVGSIQALALANTPLDLFPGSPGLYVASGFLLGLGTMVGDLAGSFVKRRQGIPQGKPSFLLDQLAFLLFALLFSYPVAWMHIYAESVAFLAAVTYFAHIGANIAANKLGLKKVPW
ncbi:MAG: CDP-2,3-bis-(O-geranylgeranyl)-sn-glycerol synthase [Candidatus Micrarchaeota archaeon]|nr:CDP-2,3-bis-(O-geranylgeranyl)-sn-glycerol synthase [Candidatus Micrarchaeota archaeon]